MSALIAWSLTACATIVETDDIAICDRPEREGDTYRAYIAWAYDLDTAIESCNALNRALKK